MPTASPERLAEVFVEMADTLVDDFDLIEFLHTVTVRTAELVDVAAVGLLLADHHGQLQVMAASDEQTKPQIIGRCSPAGDPDRLPVGARDPLRCAARSSARWTCSAPTPAASAWTTCVWSRHSPMWPQSGCSRHVRSIAARSSPSNCKER
jgi:hypothetical protein